MKLRFLGQTYSQFPQQISTIPSENIACYGRQQYNLRVPVLISRPRSPDSQMSVFIYKYCGVSYVVERHHFPTKPNRTIAYR